VVSASSRRGGWLLESQVPYPKNLVLDFIQNMSDEIRKNGDDGDLATETAKPKLKRPPLFKVLLLNDDYTPMEFVVQVLEHFFAMNREKATQIMLHVHTRGMGVCGVFSKDVAETKVAQVNDHARANQHPLLCTLEEA
jgi:ATP-dependent Clp protease adaptor protein ClpS